MVKAATLSTLAQLEQEMVTAGRQAERDALREAMNALTRSDSAYLTTGQAADRLGVSIPTIKRWIAAGGLIGAELGARWRVSAESVDRLRRVRDTLLDMDRDGNPTDEDIAELYRARRTPHGAARSTTGRA